MVPEDARLIVENKFTSLKALDELKVAMEAERLAAEALRKKREEEEMMRNSVESTSSDSKEGAKHDGEAKAITNTASAKLNDEVAIVELTKGDEGTITDSGRSTALEIIVPEVDEEASEGGEGKTVAETSSTSSVNK